MAIASSPAGLTSYTGSSFCGRSVEQPTNADSTNNPNPPYRLRIILGPSHPARGPRDRHATSERSLRIQHMIEVAVKSFLVQVTDVPAAVVDLVDVRRVPHRVVQRLLLPV